MVRHCLVNLVKEVGDTWVSCVDGRAYRFAVLLLFGHIDALLALICIVSNSGVAFPIFPLDFIFAFICCFTTL